MLNNILMIFFFFWYLYLVQDFGPGFFITEENSFFTNKYRYPVVSVERLSKLFANL